MFMLPKKIIINQQLYYRIMICNFGLLEKALRILRQISWNIEKRYPNVVMAVSSIENQLMEIKLKYDGLCVWKIPVCC